MDNKAACDIAEAKGLTRKVKHLEVQDAYICILRERGIVKIVKVASSQNRSDVMTKVFGSPGDFIHARNMLLGLSSESAGECCGESSSQIGRFISDVFGPSEDADIHGHSDSVEQHQ